MDKLTIKELVELGISRLKNLEKANLHSGRLAECETKIGQVDAVIDEIKRRLQK